MVACLSWSAGNWTTAWPRVCNRMLRSRFFEVAKNTLHPLPQSPQIVKHDLAAISQFDDDVSDAVDETVSTNVPKYSSVLSNAGG